jgi:hypothetical protein
MPPPVSQLHEVRLFAVRFGAFLLLLVALDAVAGLVLRKLYFAQSSGQYAETTYILDRMHEPVVVVGSSRAQHHYVPGVLARALGRPCYNAGRDGQGMIFYAAVLEQLFARYRPELVVLDMNPRELERDDLGYDRLSELLPYIEEHPSLRRYVELRSRFERFKLLSRAYPFNSRLLSVVQHTLVHGGTSRDSGYVALHDDLSKRAGPVNRLGDAPSRPLDPVKRDALLRTLDRAQALHTPVVVICSPQYSGDCAAQSRAAMAALLRSRGVPMWDYSADSLYRSRPELFADEVHMNDAGARLFSAEVGARLAEVMRTAVR